MRNSSFTPLAQEVNVDTVGDDISDSIYSGSLSTGVGEEILYL